MKNGLCRVAIPLLPFFLLCATAFGGDVPAPRSPVLPETIDVDTLLPGIPIILSQAGIETVEAGLKVLLIADRTIDNRLTEAFQRYLAAKEANVDVVILNGSPHTRDRVRLFAQYGDNWWPSWLWRAVTEYDALINMTYLVTGATFHEGQEIRRWFRSQGIQAALSVRPSVEKLAYTGYTRFPAEIMTAINQKVVKSIPSGKVRLHLTSPEGTDLWLDNDYGDELEGLREQGVPTSSMQVSARPTRFMNARGKIVASALNTGILAKPVTLWIEDSKVQRVDGGDGVDDYLRETFRRLDTVDFGAYGGPGVRWLEEITFTTHPQEFGVQKEGESFSGLFNNWKGAHYRSGVVHVSVGARGKPPAGFAKLYRFVFELYFPTLMVNDRTLIEDGHLLALDDPDVKATAARFGTPEQWLTEGWIPAVPGVNVP